MKVSLVSRFKTSGNFQAPAGIDVSLYIYAYSPCYQDQNGYWMCSSGTSYSANAVTDANGEAHFVYNPSNYEYLSMSVGSFNDSQKLVKLDNLIY